MGLFAKNNTIDALIDIIVEQVVITNWETLQTLCQQVNSTDDGAKQASKALRRKFREGSAQKQMNAITVTQGLIDRCGSKFKAQMVTAKFMEALRVALFSSDTNQYVRARLMERLFAWSQEFSQDPGMVAILQLYSRAKGDPELASRTVQILQDIEVANNNAHMLIEAISFADPELEAVEENELIKEFHSKCQTLHGGIRIYLNEVTASVAPNEKCLAGLLNSNEELIRALAAYDHMMERNSLDKASRIINTEHVPPALEYQIVEYLDNGAGVGAGYITISSNGKDKHTIGGQATFDPFADDAYYVSDITTAIKNEYGFATFMRDTGCTKRPAFAEESDRIINSEQEQRMIQLTKERSLMDESRNGSSSSSSAAPATTAVAHPVVASTV
ncbi:putative actin patch assembly and actin polymerization protein [Entomortierella chlamydospora]|nr:putative actin patch assembly and actin polymerization protein [Entomortierella chlamydospora]